MSVYGYNSDRSMTLSGFLAMSMFDSREKLNDLGIELDSRSMKSDR